jgi:hypothetical protein
MDVKSESRHGEVSSTTGVRELTFSLFPPSLKDHLLLLGIAWRSEEHGELYMELVAFREHLSEGAWPEGVEYQEFLVDAEGGEFWVRTLGKSPEEKAHLALSGNTVSGSLCGSGLFDVFSLRNIPISLIEESPGHFVVVGWVKERRLIHRLAAKALVKKMHILRAMFLD